jgi:hypothetical protein
MAIVTLPVRKGVMSMSGRMFDAVELVMTKLDRLQPHRRHGRHRAERQQREEHQQGGKAGHGHRSGCSASL